VKCRKLIKLWLTCVYSSHFCSACFSDVVITIESLCVFVPATCIQQRVVSKFAQTVTFSVGTTSAAPAGDFSAFHWSVQTDLWHQSNRCGFFCHTAQKVSSLDCCRKHLMSGALSIHVTCPFCITSSDVLRLLSWLTDMLVVLHDSPQPVL
jgi:hypothetical protein